MRIVYRQPACITLMSVGCLRLAFPAIKAAMIGFMTTARKAFAARSPPRLALGCTGPQVRNGSLHIYQTPIRQDEVWCTTRRPNERIAHLHASKTNSSHRRGLTRNVRMNLSPKSFAKTLVTSSAAVLPFAVQNVEGFLPFQASDSWHTPGSCPPDRDRILCQSAISLRPCTYGMTGRMGDQGWPRARERSASLSQRCSPLCEESCMSVCAHQCILPRLMTPVRDVPGILTNPFTVGALLFAVVPRGRINICL